MRKNHTQIAVVLDRSGSMQSIRQATQDGYNEFLKGQQEAAGTADLMLVQFDHDYELIYDGPISQARPLTLCPRGNTALLDALGRTIKDLGARLHAKDEDARPEHVVFVIVTDGEENASHEYSREQVFDMIHHQRTKYKWDFIFLAANQDAIKAATDIGGKYMAGNAATYAFTTSGMLRNMNMATHKLADARAEAMMGGSFSKKLRYTKADRDALASDKEEEDDPDRPVGGGRPVGSNT